MKFVPHSQAYRQARVDAPLVLKEKAVVPCDTVHARAGLSLIHIGRQAQQKIRDRITCASRKIVVKPKNAIIVRSREVERTRPMESLKVDATLKRVAAFDPG